MDAQPPKAQTYLIEPYDQSELIGIYVNVLGTTKVDEQNTIRKGICQTMSLYWIRQKLDELASEKKHDAKGIMRSIDTDFDKIADLQTVKDFKKYKFNIYGAAEEEYQLRKQENWVEAGTHVRLTLEFISNKVTGSKKSCWLFSFECYTLMGASMGSHAIAFYLSSGKILGKGQHVYVFDPNHGEFKVPKSTFKSWLATHLREKYNRKDDLLGKELIKY